MSSCAQPWFVCVFSLSHSVPSPQVSLHPRFRSVWLVFPSIGSFGSVSCPLRFCFFFTYRLNKAHSDQKLPASWVLPANLHTYATAGVTMTFQSRRSFCWVYQHKMYKFLFNIHAYSHKHGYIRQQVGVQYLPKTWN